MKRIFTILCAAALAMSLWANGTKVGGINYIFRVDGTASVTYPGDEVPDLYHPREDYTGKIVIPDKVTYNDKEYTVTEIGRLAFAYCVSLEEVALPNTIEVIGRSAFSGCGIFDYINLPYGIKVIDQHAFYNCNNFTYFIIPESVTTIDTSAFAFCENLESVKLPNSLTSLKYMAFEGCKNLKTVNIPNQLTRIPANAFASCKSLTAITIPNNITSIGRAAFHNSGLTSITFPKNITSIEENVCGVCTDLKHVVLGSGVESIEMFAFAECKKLEDIIVYSNNLISVEDERAFDEVYLADIDVYVSSNISSAYAADPFWNQFMLYYLEADIIADVNNISVFTDANSANIVWYCYENAETYELTVFEKGTLKKVCVLVFDWNGYLLSIDYPAAPSRAPQAGQETGFSFTVTGLDPGRDYTYELLVKDADENVIDSKSGEFSTTAEGGTPTAIGDVEAGVRTTKLIRDGQVLIRCGDKVYTLHGSPLK